MAERVFQSTPPARGATCEAIALQRFIEISIHAPREGGDRARATTVHGRRRISIHAPREGGDLFHGIFGVVAAISIPAPREGGDN